MAPLQSLEYNEDWLESEANSISLAPLAIKICSL